MQARQHLHEVRGDGGRHGRVEPGQVVVLAEDPAVSELHHVERCTDHVRAAEQQRPGHGDVGRGQRCEQAVLAAHVVRGLQDVAQRRPAQHPPVSPVGEQVGQVGAASREQGGGQRTLHQARQLPVQVVLDRHDGQPG